MNRREARILAMQYIFQMGAQGNFSAESLDDFISDKKAGGQKQYIASVINSVCENIAAIDGVINENSSGWSVSRMAKADLAVLRLAAAEILYDEDIPNPYPSTKPWNWPRYTETTNQPALSMQFLRT